MFDNFQHFDKFDFSRPGAWSSHFGNEDFIRVAMAEIENNLAISKKLHVPFVVDPELWSAYAERVKEDLQSDIELVRLVQANFKRVLDKEFSITLSAITIPNANEPEHLDFTNVLDTLEEILEVRGQTELLEFKKWLIELQSIQEKYVPHDLKRATYVSRKVIEKISETQRAIIEVLTEYDQDVTSGAGILFRYQYCLTSFPFQ